MSIDAVMSALARLATYLLPILGVVVLVYLIFVLKGVLVTLKDLSKTLNAAEREINKLDGPLATVEELSKTADEIHHATKKAVTSAINVVTENADNLKTWLWLNSKKNTASDTPSEEQIQKDEEVS